MYITPTEIRAVIGSPEADDTILLTLIESVEGDFNSAIQSEGIMASEKTEFVPFDSMDVTARSGIVFALKTYAPSSLTSINGATVPAQDYVIMGRKLSLRTAIPPQDYPRGWTIVYTSGLTTPPADIKSAIRDAVASAYSTRKAQGISEFRQDLLTVKYVGSGRQTPGGDSNESGGQFPQALLAKYRIPSTIVS